MIRLPIGPPARRSAALALAVMLGSAAALPLVPGLTAPLAAAPAPAGELPGSFADLVERVSPAVVSIVVTRPAGPATISFDGPRQGNPFAPFFREFGFPDLFPPLPELRRDGEREAPRREGRGVGSGFIIDPDGYIVTNHHVIAEANEVIVVLEDGRRLDATVVGSDAAVDLALLRVASDTPLPYLTFGDSDAVRVGDWTIAVGNPFGLGGTVTAGIVSARSRDINAGPYDDFLQIDASINRGNSGGPTFDVHGNVIGINTAIFSPTGGNVGIGFAIPSNLAQPLLAQLREQGHVTRGWLGVQIQPVTALIAESLGLDDARGALIAEVTPESPAAAAGLAVGDVILALEETPVRTLRDLTRTVALATPGEPQAFTVWRRGETMTLAVAPGQAPRSALAAAEVAPAIPAAVLVDTLGVQLAALDEAARERAGLAADAEGVVVVAVEGPAADWLAAGDVILSIDNLPVASPAEVAERVAAAEAADRGVILVLINRQGEQRFATLDLRLA